MSLNSLALPFDIPWRRVCVTEDMNDYGAGCEPPPLTEWVYPPQWKSSIAISIYEPDKEEQDAEGLIPANPYEAGGNTQRIVYYKITVTITPYVPKTELASSQASSYLTNPKFTPYPQTYPCYGALLQVSVRPESSELPREDWPYIVDCEPKKRELYEAVTETGEVMTGSREGLSTTKSGGTTFGIGAMLGSIIPIPGGEIAGKLVDSFSSTSSSAETTDKSSERRETQGHSTQLSQMYHLFQAFHVGTNRGMFLMEPRPHTKNTPTTFLKKTRELEGIQEIFIAVAKKWDAEDEPLCLEVRLDTAHLYDISQEDDLNLAGLPEGWLEEKKLITLNTTGPYIDGYWFNEKNYNAPAGYKIYSLKVSSPKGDGHPGAKKESDIKYKIFWDNPWRAYEDKADITVEVRLYPEKLTAEEIQESIEGMFLLGRKLCCCDGSVEEGVIWHGPIDPPPPPPEDKDDPTRTISTDILKSRSLAMAIRTAILDSTQSPYRKEPGEVPFTQSDPFFVSMANAMLQESPALNSSIAVASGLTPTQRDKLLTGLGPVPASTFVAMDSDMLSLKTGIAVQELAVIKDQVLKSAKPLPVIAPSTTPQRGVIGLSLLSSHPNPSYPRTVYKYLSPTVSAVVNDYDRINVIDVIFNGKPDAGTVTTSTFYAELAGSALPGSIQQLNDTTYRLILTASLPPGTVPRIVLKGVGASFIAFGGVALGGSINPSFPTGNKITPADFTAAVEVIAAQPPAPPAPAPTILLKVIGVDLTTTTGTPHVLATMVTPGAVLQVNSTDSPNTIDVRFNNTPTGGTVSTSSFLVSSPTGPIAGTVSSLGSNVYRFVPSAPLPAGVIYTVSLVASIIAFSGNPLDGDPIALPSGDGVPGTNFSFMFQVN